MIIKKCELVGKQVCNEMCALAHGLSHWYAASRRIQEAECPPQHRVISRRLRRILLQWVREEDTLI
jgi:hypothetical protein